jgi:hypothetical protein
MNSITEVATSPVVSITDASEAPPEAGGKMFERTEITDGPFNETVCMAFPE